MCHSVVVDGGDLIDGLREFSAALKSAGAKGVVYIHDDALTDADPDRCLCGTDFERTANEAAKEIGCLVEHRYDPEFWDHYISFNRKATHDREDEPRG